MVNRIHFSGSRKTSRGNPGERSSVRGQLPRRRSRLAHQRVRQSLLRASETQSQRPGRLAALRLRQRRRTTAESAEDRRLRLAALRIRQRLRVAAESAEDRRRRLAALRIRQRLRVAAESAENRTLAVVPLAHKRAPASATQQNLLMLAPQPYITVA